MLSNHLVPRRYQEAIFATTANNNTLVVLPTGLGKTMIAAMTAAHRLTQHPESKIIFLAPTKPLVEQHLESFKKLINLPEEKFVLFTGTTPPKKRAEQYTQAQIIMSTPQGLENDVMSNRINLDPVSLLIFDEAHRAVGDYSYVYLAKRYEEKNNARILALTASPGSDKEKILEVIHNLHITKVEVKQETDHDVAPYVQETDITWHEVPFPQELKKIQKTLQDCLQKKVAEIKEYGIIKDLPQTLHKTALLKLQGELQGMIARGEKDFEVLKTISVVAQAMKVQHAIELVETQGIRSFNKYTHQLCVQASKGGSKATQNLVQDTSFKQAVYEANNLAEELFEHPKLDAVKNIILKKLQTPETKIIIFTQYREQASTIQQELSKQRIASKVFVGQAKKSGTGLSQKEQKAMIDEFSTGEFPVLIATSVAEEGLDIPKVDLVLFYEPVPSAIRTVQRRGRTGRLERGEVIVLITKGTRDVGTRWVAHHKEQRMYRALKEVQRTLVFVEKKEPKEQTTLQEYNKTKNNTVTVKADHREKGSQVLKTLLDLQTTLDLQQLAIGDFLVSDRCVIEYKTIPDFVDSIIDGRLLTQLRGLRQYARPIIVLEGEQDIYAQRNIHPNAIRGMIATITLGYGIPLLYTKNPRESAHIIYAIARREQEATKEFNQQSTKPQESNEQLEHIIASIPGLGPGLAKPLLKEFKNVHKIMTASVEELAQTPGIGTKKAEQIHEIIRRTYEEE